MDEPRDPGGRLPVAQAGDLPPAGDGRGHRARAHRRPDRGGAGSRHRPRRDRPALRHARCPPPRAGGARVRLQGRSRPPVRLGPAAELARVVALLHEVRRARRARALPAGHSAEFMPSACGKPILLDDIAIWFPELELVGAHTGWPWVEELIAMAWKHPNVYIATSGARAQVLGPEARPVPERAQPRHRQGDVGHRLPADRPRRGPEPDRRVRPQARGGAARFCATSPSSCSSSTRTGGRRGARRLARRGGLRRRRGEPRARRPAGRRPRGERAGARRRTAPRRPRRGGDEDRAAARATRSSTPRLPGMRRRPPR